MKTTIEMACEAGFDTHTSEVAMNVFFTEELKAFEALVRADEAEKYKWDVHSCGPTCKRYACVAMREAVEAEREACAKVCDELANDENTDEYINGADWCAVRIRARGNT